MPLGTNSDGRSGDGLAGENWLQWLEEQLRYLKGRQARHEPAVAYRLDELLNAPQRCLSPDEIERETRRLLAVCAAKGVEAVVPEVATCRSLLLSLAAACHTAGLTSAGQYLDYLSLPYPSD
jgi:hypothetical protein